MLCSATDVVKVEVGDFTDGLVGCQSKCLVFGESKIRKRLFDAAACLVLSRKEFAPQISGPGHERYGCRQIPEVQFEEMVNIWAKSL